LNQQAVQRLATGVPGLDNILGGGLLPRRTVLLKGAPGSGKTTLGLQMLVAGAQQFNEPGLLLSFEQAPEQLLEDGAAFGWPLAELIEQKKLGIMLVTPEQILESSNRHENRVLLNIEDWVEEYGARRIMIDSLSHLLPFFGREDARGTFMTFMLALKRMGLTPILTAELSGDTGALGLDAYLVDTLIQLRPQHGGFGSDLSHRTLEVLKSRGSRALAGEHPFDIDGQGLRLYPRAEVAACPPAASQPVSSGLAGLDALLHGGYLPGSVILAAGVSGTYKTTLLAHFLLADSEPALWITFNETAAELQRELAGRGFDLAAAQAAGHLHIMPLVLGAEPVEKVLTLAEAIVRTHGITRIGVDNPSDFGATMNPDQLEAVRWFLRRLRALGVTTMFTQRLARPTGANPLAEIVGPELADTIIYLGLVEIESRLEKVLSVIKHRGGETGGELVGITCGPHGLRVSERFVGLAGVLSGTALGKRKAQIEEIFQPLFFIRDFLAMARNPQLASDRREAMLGNLSAEANRLIELLSKYFDQPLPGQSSEAAGKPGARHE
jgi:circadian clock protein KaiC